ncbi:MAG: aminoacyl-tRNA hydrolase [Candidatus Paceibacterota bacterium]
MQYIIIGLGNPGEEYVGTRHNVGRMVLEAFAKANDLADWKEDKKLKSLVTQGKVGKNKAMFLQPETFMNKSGEAVKSLVKSKKAAETLIVIHDDLDIPLGKLKISFNKSSGGHRGVESIIKTVKTEAFTRIRIGISGETASGKIKKPQGEEKVIDTILGEFKKTEELELKKIIKKSVTALSMVIKDGWSIAASQLGNL